jgi:hypothetical protein
MLNNEHGKANDKGIAEIVCFISQGFLTSVYSEKMLNVQTCTVGFGGNILYLNNHLLF